MKIKLNNDSTLKVKLTKKIFKSSKFGLTEDSAILLFQGEEYKCYPRFSNGKIIISGIYQTEPDTSIIIKQLPEFFIEKPISNFKRNRILFRLNRHKLSYRIFNFKDALTRRKKTFWSFVIPIIGGLLYYFTNHYTDNYLMELISSNLIVQSVIFTLSVIGIMKLYRPFSIKQSFTAHDAEQIYKRMRQREKDNEEMQKRSTF